MVSKSSGRNESERRYGLEKRKPQGPSSLPESEGNRRRRKLTNAADHTGGVKATARWQGHTEQLERPFSPRRESGGKENRITGNTGKSVDGERESEGPIRATKRS